MGKTGKPDRGQGYISGGGTSWMEKTDPRSGSKIIRLRRRWEDILTSETFKNEKTPMMGEAKAWNN